MRKYVRGSIQKRLAAYSQPAPSGCIEWTGDRHLSRGYGRINIGGRMVLAHRASLEVSIGRPIKKGLQALHKCDNRLCINPEHLYEGSPAQNSRDMVDRSRSRAGERHHAAILVESDIPEIRRLSKSGMMGKDIARQYGVCSGTIYAIIKGTRWKHVA